MYIYGFFVVLFNPVVKINVFYKYSLFFTIFLLLNLVAGNSLRISSNPDAEIKLAGILFLHGCKTTFPDRKITFARMQRHFSQAECYLCTRTKTLFSSRILLLYTCKDTFLERNTIFARVQRYFSRAEWYFCTRAKVLFQ